MSIKVNPRNNQKSVTKPTYVPPNFDLDPIKNPKRRSRPKPDLPFVRELKHRGVPYTTDTLKKGFGS